MRHGQTNAGVAGAIAKKDEARDGRAGGIGPQAPQGHLEAEPTAGDGALDGRLAKRQVDFHSRNVVFLFINSTHYMAEK
ncbi:MAG: hypothetical protein ACKOGJ_05500, partial [Phycisphaerales bacterium]